MLFRSRKKNAAQQIGLKGNSRNISAHRLRRLFTEKSTKEEAETSAVVSSRQSLRLLHLRSKEKSNSGDGKKKNSDDSDKESLDLLRRKRRNQNHSTQQMDSTITTIPEEDDFENYEDGGSSNAKSLSKERTGRRGIRTKNSDAAIVSTKEATSTCNNRLLDERFDWVSPHPSDDIFSDFHLDDIVKDYEKLQRKIHYHPGSTDAIGIDNSDKEDQDEYLDDNEYVNKDGEGALRITVRYLSINKFCLGH